MFHKTKYSNDKMHSGLEFVSTSHTQVSTTDTIYYMHMIPKIHVFVVVDATLTRYPYVLMMTNKPSKHIK